MKQVAIIAAVVSLVANSPMVVAKYLAVGEIGPCRELDVVGFFTFMLVPIAVFAALVMALALPFAKRRRVALETLVAFAAYALVGFMCLKASWWIRQIALEDLTERASPIISAIEHFEADHHVPPASMNELVPTYLHSIPPTKMAACLPFEFESGQTAREMYGDRWVLRARPYFQDRGSWEFWYVPSKNYSYRSSMDIVVERIGDWGYIVGY
jgi:hypothetical protein